VKVRQQGRDAINQYLGAFLSGGSLISVIWGEGKRMRVLAMASQKGGSGKTTLSGHLAVQAQLAGAGPVCLIDIDPQGSLADWWNERQDEMPAFAQTTVARLASDL
jgi:chromosome partitioning protein